MIPEYQWPTEVITDGAEIIKTLSLKIDGFLRQNETPQISLFSFNPGWGRLGVKQVERKTLEENGIKAMEVYGLDQDSFRPDEREHGLNQAGARVVHNGAKQYRVYPSQTDSKLEFVREATYLKPVNTETGQPVECDDVNQMYPNNVKWSLRFSVDPGYLDVHP